MNDEKGVERLDPLLGAGQPIWKQSISELTDLAIQSD